jgi:NAD/NADP transhydrogenase alpha subunit
VHEADLIREGGTLISFLYPGKNTDIVDTLAARKATAIAVDQIPRITRAQKMDALSSMANIAGYRAVVEAASFYGRLLHRPDDGGGQGAAAKVLVIGAGVAGWRRSARRAAWARSCARSTRGRRSKSKSRAWAPSSSSSTSPKTARARAAMRRK